MISKLPVGQLDLLRVVMSALPARNARALSMPPGHVFIK